MCRRCEQLIDKLQPSMRCPVGDRDGVDQCIQEIFHRAYLFLDERSGGSVRQDLDRATDNLAKMYELDAPEFLIRKALAVQIQRLRSYRSYTRTNAASAMRSAELRRRLTLVRGGKL